MNRALLLLAAALVIAAPLGYANLRPLQQLGEGQIADSVRLEKAARRLTLFRGTSELKASRSPCPTASTSRVTSSLDTSSIDPPLLPPRTES